MPERSFDLNIRVHADDRASNVLGLIGGGVQRLGNVAMLGISAIGAGIGVAAAGLGAFTAQAIASNSAFEQYETQFATLLGSTEAAQQRMQELALFGATTPFDLPGVVEANRILTGFGLTSEEVAEKFGFSADQIMTIAGDVASGTGLQFQEMALLMGKFSAGATGEVIARFQELGIMTREQMAAMGIEFSKAGEMLTPVPEAMEIVLGMMEEKYGGLMDAQSQTFEGMMSNIRDWVAGTIREVGRPIFDKAKEGLSRLLTFLNGDFVKQSLEVFSRFASEGVATAIAAIEELVEVASELFANVRRGMTPINALGVAVERLFGGDVSSKFMQFAGVLQDVIDGVNAVLGPVMQWFAENTRLTDVLMILGVALASVILPAIWGVLQPLLIVVGIFVGLIALVTLLRTAWENDFLGIRTAFETIWNEGLKPVFDELMLFFEQQGPGAMEVLRSYWEEVLLPAIQIVGDWIQNTLMPILTELAIHYIKNVWESVKILAEFWSKVLWPALQSVWAFVKDNLLPVFVELVTKGIDFVGEAVESMVYVWSEYVVPALQAVRNFMDTIFIPIIETLAQIISAVLVIAVRVMANVWRDDILPVLGAVKGRFDEVIGVMHAVSSAIWDRVKPAFDNVVNSIRPVVDFIAANVLGTLGTLWSRFDGISGAIGAANGAISRMIGWLSDLLSWLRSVLDMLNKVADALAGVGGAGPMGGLSLGDDRPRGSGSGGGMGGAMTVNNFVLNYATTQSSQSVYSDVETLKARFGG